MTKKIIAIIQARISSTRLPGKVMKQIFGRELLSIVVDRVRKANLVTDVVVATSVKEDDDIIYEWCNKNKVQVFRGSEKNVLSRYYECAKYFEADVIVRVTSDNPLIDSEVIDQVVKIFLDENCDFAANNIVKSFPHGLDVEVISYKALEESCKSANLPQEKEHVTQYVRHRPEVYKIRSLTYEKTLYDIRLTVDEQSDLELVEIVYLLTQGEVNLKNLVNLFEKFPSLKNVNKNSAEAHRKYNLSENII